MTRTIAVIAALDTKGDEARFVRDSIVARGHRVLLIDVGVLGQPQLEADITREHVAEAGGAALDQLVGNRDKASAMAAMTRGAAVVAGELHANGAIDGIIGFGGTAGTVIGASAMRALPVGVPKVLVSTVASGDTRPYVGTRDIAMLYSVVDIAGLNRISSRVLQNAAGAICGMVESDAVAGDEKPMIAASMFGNTTACVDQARAVLDAAGYEVLVFHATGAGGETMESLIRDRFFSGVLDLTTTELADALCGGVFSAGDTRLDAAAESGVPQVVAPGCVDMVNFGGPDTVPARYAERRLYAWNPNVTLMRTTPEENAILGRTIAEKVNQSTAPTAVLLPLGGVSQLDSVGGEFWWPEANRALFDAIRSTVRSGIEVIEVDANINDQAFSDRAAELLLSFVGRVG